MASAVITLGYSSSGGFQGGNNKLITLGYLAAASTTAECVSLKASSFGIAQAIGKASFNTVVAKPGIARSEGSICG